MHNGTKCNLCLLGLAITTLERNIELTRCEYDPINSRVIVYVRDLINAEAALMMESKHGEMNFEGITIRGEEE